jgi:peptidoglycan/LPS O-acetylase OafA/YrhL
LKKQIHLEAVRGLAALLVVVHHYGAAFYPATCFGEKYPAHENCEKMFTSTPLGLVVAGQFAVCLFFILSGYVLSLPYFGANVRNSSHLLAAMVKRPFRLGGLVVFSELVAIALGCFHLYFNAPVSQVTHSTPWFSEFWAHNTLSFRHIASDILINTFDAGSKYNWPLWTIRLELYGSFIIYIILLLCRKSSLRGVVYLYALIYFRGSLYQGFIFGIMLADISRNYSGVIASCSRPLVAIPLLLLGLLFASYPGYVDPAELARTMYGHFVHLPGLADGYAMLGAIVLFVALLLNPGLQHALSSRVFARLGRVSYALYAVHFIVLASFSSWLFLSLSDGFTYNEKFLMTFCASLVVLYILSVLLARYVDEPATRFADWLGKRWLEQESNEMGMPNTAVGASAAFGSRAESLPRKEEEGTRPEVDPVA